MTKRKNMYDRLALWLVLFFVFTGYAQADVSDGGVTGPLETPRVDILVAVSDKSDSGNIPVAEAASPAVSISEKKKSSEETSSEDKSDVMDDESNDDNDLFNDDSPVNGNKDGDVLVADPLIRYNRFMFSVNDKLYFWCLKPVAYGYRAVTPTFFRIGVKNFFHNLTTPVRFVNSALQGKVKGASSELGRFFVNTTVGVVGVWDPAEKYLGWKPSEEDFGQVLGKYHIGNGFYIVWPFFGPSTLRDSIGMVGDMFLDPANYLTSTELALGAEGLDVLNRTSFRVGDYESVKAASMDPYVMIRDFYIEYRNKKIAE